MKSDKFCQLRYLCFASKIVCFPLGILALLGLLLHLFILFVTRDSTAFADAIANVWTCGKLTLVCVAVVGFADVFRAVADIAES